MYNFLFGSQDKDDSHKQLLDTNSDLDNLYLDVSSKKVEYIDEMLNYVEKKEYICKITLTIICLHKKIETWNYYGKFYGNKENNKYYVFCSINLKPREDIGKMRFTIEINKHHKIYYKNTMSFNYKINNDEKNLLENISISNSPGHDLVMSVSKNNEDKYIIDNIKFIRDLAN